MIMKTQRSCFPKHYSEFFDKIIPFKSYNILWGITPMCPDTGTAALIPHVPSSSPYQTVFENMIFFFDKFV